MKRDSHTIPPYGLNNTSNDNRRKFFDFFTFVIFSSLSALDIPILALHKANLAMYGYALMPHTINAARYMSGVYILPFMAIFCVI
jgi:hypothetical protein